eukprot:gb/GFBE01034493.1/.p1 GENE.gb/GFBE01034493.1/~~gb/GFBE01034493.1/.p1  ORF type:complete len:114 (+),score=24.18 gb/GFBE01034493.1/:1-342(+)
MNASQTLPVLLAMLLWCNSHAIADATAEIEWNFSLARLLSAAGGLQIQRDSPSTDKKQEPVWLVSPVHLVLLFCGSCCFAYLLSRCLAKQEEARDVRPGVKIGASELDAGPAE